MIKTLTSNFSFSALEHCAPLASSPKYLVQALLLGPLSRETVAAFLNGHDSLREDVKRAFLEAETWTKSEQTWQKAVLKWAHIEHTNVPKFAEFRESTLDLIRQLSGGQWAASVVNCTQNGLCKCAHGCAHGRANFLVLACACAIRAQLHLSTLAHTMQFLHGTCLRNC